MASDQKIYHSALELEPDKREAFLKKACVCDEALFKEVTSLLTQEGNSEGLLTEERDICKSMFCLFYFVVRFPKDFNLVSF
jgi:hypothetical protein